MVHLRQPIIDDSNYDDYDDDEDDDYDGDDSDNRPGLTLVRVLGGAGVVSPVAIGILISEDYYCYYWDLNI